jgi:hypothetical protein
MPMTMNMNELLQSKTVTAVLKKYGISVEHYVTSTEKQVAFYEKLKGKSHAWHVMNQRKLYSDLLIPIGISKSDAERYSDMNSANSYRGDPPDKVSEFMFIVALSTSLVTEYIQRLND